MKLGDVVLVVAFICTSSIGILKGSCNPFKEHEIPLIVKQAFEKEFPGKKASWEVENGNYEAEFDIDQTHASVTYGHDGVRLEMEIEIAMNLMPPAALIFMKQKHAGIKIKETSKITDKNNIITYEAEIKNEGKSIDVIFDDQGKFIKETEGE